MTKPSLPDVPMSSGKKRPRTAWTPSSVPEGGKENKAPRTRRESLMPKAGRMAGNDAPLAPRM